jgi:hypothetical protein
MEIILFMSSSYIKSFQSVVLCITVVINFSKNFLSSKFFVVNKFTTVRGNETGVGGKKIINFSLL